MLTQNITTDDKLKQALMSPQAFNIQFKLKSMPDSYAPFPDAPLKSEPTPYADMGISNIDYSYMTPGWLEPQDSNTFIYDMIENPTLLNQSTVVTMNSLIKDLNYLDVDFKWETQRGDSTSRSIYDSDGNEYSITADPKGKSIKLEQIKRTDPDINKRQLFARPIHARSYITDNFLEENVMKENFLAFWKNYLAQKSAPAFESLHLFAKINDQPMNSRGSASNLVRGLLSQFNEVSLINGKTESTYVVPPKDKPQGFSRLVFADNIINGLFEVLTEYGDQNGDSMKNTFVLPPQIISRLKSEIAADRETPLGDKIYTEGGVPKLIGNSIKQDDVLRKSENGWNTMAFYKKPTSADADEKRHYKKVPDGGDNNNSKTYNDIVYGFLGKPSNIVFGMFKNFNMFHARNHMGWGWDIGMRAKSDVTFLKQQDTLIIPFTMHKESEHEK